MTISLMSTCRDKFKKWSSNINLRSNDRNFTLTLYFAATVLIFSDQNLLAPNLTEIGEEFSLDDKERDEMLGGYISLAFFLVGAPAGFLTGILADRVSNRSVLFAFVIYLGEGACFATYFSRTYNQLLFLRALTGLSVGGAIPVIYSVLGDLYSRHERSRVAAMVTCGAGLGVIIGQAIAGFVGSHYGWRLPFLIVSVPAFVCATMMLFLKDPPRGLKEDYLDIVDATIQDDPCCSLSSSSSSSMDEEDSLEQGAMALSLHSDKSGGNCTSDGDYRLLESIHHNSITAAAVVEIKQQKTLQQQQSGRSSSSSSLCVASTGVLQDSDALSVETQSLCDNNASAADDDGSDLGSDNRSRSYNIDTAHAGYAAETRDFSVNLNDGWLHFKQTMAQLFRTKSVIILLAQGMPGCIFWGVVNTYLNDYLAEDRGLSVEAATTTLLVFGLGLFFGVMLGGFVGEFLYNKDVRYPPLLAGIAEIVGCVPMALMVNYAEEGTPTWAIMTMSLCAGTMVAVTGPIVKSTLSNVTMPTSRGQAFALLSIFDDLGRGLGPFFVSLLIDKFGRREAFNLALIGWVISGALNSSIYFYAAHDERLVRQQACRNQ
uniref:Major facilitator superfamily (MFS) profile domain-containing protein n=1 Tax=Leptocylindrus danicus TaxID=163516 RepID=A0A7S2KRC2_9STRA|eukprot:CAMPEP_0116019830 /NCGR_PEP_ID=MMETSP0321-20121206/9458_1 /TAXON_ID=163516 /ORGANISM="Leptocylindrus danicus var. danicus, Strain B650" /LENGTH=600 /DNA_ID=CAMNT_0003490451 /DNA_START=182 /DNA_END=1984 /DNA_ORIENTATION=-